MRLYVTPAGQWAGTQADAKRLGQFTEVDVPTDKPGLLAWLNENRVGDTGQRGCCPYMGTAQCECGEDEDDVTDLLGETETPAPPPLAPRAVDAVLAQCDVEEAIQQAELPALASYASNVAWRFKELGR